MKNPWQALEKEKVYENPWIKVEHHKVINPANKEGIYGTVHFKNLAIGVVPLDHDHNCWLVGQYRYPLDKYSWEIPEGGGKLNVSPLESAQRELKEETGLVAKDWQEVQRIHTSNSVTDELGIIYLAQGLKELEAEPDEEEVLEIRKLPFKEVLKMVFDSKITDSLSVAGILKVNYLIENNLI